MPVIYLETRIHAPIERCFDLSRSIDLHKQSLAYTRERAIAGVTSGLIGLNQEVTWEAIHFGIRQRLSVRITAFDPPYHFQDVMLKGAFAHLRHDHHFEPVGEHCRMRDIFDYASPFGPLGILADKLFLEQYMTELLLQRNRLIQQVAESEQWQALLPTPIE